MCQVRNVCQLSVATPVQAAFAYGFVLPFLYSLLAPGDAAMPRILRDLRQKGFDPAKGSNNDWYLAPSSYTLSKNPVTVSFVKT